MNPLMQLRSLGQSVCYLNILKGLVSSGGLRRMIEEYGVTGASVGTLTLERAIRGTSLYDQDIKRLSSIGLTAKAIALELVIEDAKAGAGALEGIYKSTMAGEGLITCPIPGIDLNNADSIVTEALRLRSSVNKPNIIFAIQATPAGMIAIERLTFEGCGLEVIGVFTGEKMSEACAAYLKGLERRLAAGMDVKGSHCAISFRVGALGGLIDSLIEQRISQTPSNDEKARLKAMLGKGAIAAARDIYSRHAEVFSSGRFARFKAKGALPMRIVWDDLSVRDPRQADLKYAEALVMEGTISRMSHQTLLAFYSHGRPALAQADEIEEAKKTLAELAALSIDLPSIARTLEDESAQKSAASCRALADSIAAKMALPGGGSKDSVRFSIGDCAVEEDASATRLDDEGFLTRLWLKDASLWKDTPQDRAVIKNSLGWLSSPEFMNSVKGGIISFASQVRAEGFTATVLLGMGGSSLAPIVFSQTIAVDDGYPVLYCLDSTDPDAIASVGRLIDLEKTLFIVSSKSGSTIEPLSLFEHFYGQVKAVKGEKAGQNFCAITESGTPLEGYGRKYGFRRVFLNPVDIGGRFSALSYFGLVPAALSGIDITRLLNHSLVLLSSIQPFMKPSGSSAVRLGTAIGTLAMKGRDKLTFVLPPALSSFGLWIEQLIAESTGKEGKGIVPITGERLMKPSDYGSDRAFVCIHEGEQDARTARFAGDLVKAGHPVISLRIDDVYETGAELLRWETAVTVAGHLMRLNPFDQPDVELAKKLTIGLLNSGGKKSALVPPGVLSEGDGLRCAIGRAAISLINTKTRPSKAGKDAVAVLKDFIGLAVEGDYIGLLAYCNPFDRVTEKSLDRLRSLLSASSGCPVQFGYGPRYLHSTGQLHKGGPNKGVFLIICHDSLKDIPIPESPFSFSELELSQAFGDMEALDSKGCRVALLYLPDSSRASFDAALRSVEAALSA